MATEIEKNELVVLAQRFAEAAHHGQQRGLDPYPYIRHPEMVVSVLRHIDGCTPEMLAAAWLHDVVEDAELPEWTIEFLFGKKVTSMVMALTKSSDSSLSRAERNAKYNKQLSEAGPEVHSIKLADIIDNLADIEESGFTEKFIAQYLQEKRECLAYLHKGDAGLLKTATLLATPMDEDFSAEVAASAAGGNSVDREVTAALQEIDSILEKINSAEELATYTY